MSNINKTSYLKFIYCFLSILFILPVFVIDSCDSSSPKNNKPTIDLITATPNKLAYGELSTVTVTATDKDNDNLTYSWSCDDGSFSSTNNTNIVIWQAPNKVGMCGVTVTVNDGEDEVLANADIEIKGLFFDEFSTDLSKWSNSYCSSWLASGEGHVEGNSSLFYGTVKHNMDQYLSPEYTINMNLARVDNFASDEFYGLYSEVDDVGSIIIPYWVFAIEPSTTNENWEVICFLYSSSTYGWVLLSDDSYGYSSLIHNSTNTFNEISWTIEQDKTVIVHAGNQLLYQTNEIAYIENTYGMTITMDLVDVGIRTFYNNEVKFDDITITTPSNSLPKFMKEKNDRGVQTSLLLLASQTKPNKISKLKTLREVLSEIK